MASTLIRVFRCRNTLDLSTVSNKIGLNDTAQEKIWNWQQQSRWQLNQAFKLVKLNNTMGLTTG